MIALAEVAATRGRQDEQYGPRSPRHRATAFILVGSLIARPLYILGGFQEEMP